MNAPLPKSPYGNVKMTIYFDIINLSGNYMVVNELKIPYENKEFKKNKNLHAKLFFEIHTKMIMIRTYENMAHFKLFKSP
jgi:hypothetical protein